MAAARRSRPTARHKALALLGKRALTRAELRERLTRAGYPDDEVSDAVELVSTYGYLNDAEIAANVRNKAEAEGRGPLWLQKTLRRRGIDETATASDVRALDVQAERIARELLERKFGAPADLCAAEARRAFQFLVRRGFEPAHAQQALGCTEEWLR